MLRGGVLFFSFTFSYSFSSSSSSICKDGSSFCFFVGSWVLSLQKSCCTSCTQHIFNATNCMDTKLFNKIKTKGLLKYKV